MGLEAQNDWQWERAHKASRVSCSSLFLLRMRRIVGCDALEVIVEVEDCGAVFCLPAKVAARDVIWKTAESKDA